MNLGARYWRFSRNAHAIGAAFEHATMTPVDPECSATHALARENATIQLQDQWSAYCRDMITASWRGGCTTLGGVVIPKRAGLSSYASAVAALRATYVGTAKKSKYWEPKWFDPVQALDAAKRLGVPNLPTLSAGLGLTPSPLDELRAVRNYFAHRGPESCDRLQPFLGARATVALVHQHVSAPTLAGVPQLVRWVHELDTMAWAAAL